jgi:hypothetical protein
MSQAQKEGVCVTHGAQTRRCDHKGCSKQVVRGGMCNSHGQSERPQMVWGRCSECPMFSNTMRKVDGDLVCVCYPCMSHSGKGDQCKARGCIKYVHPMKGEKQELHCVFHCSMAFKRCIHPGCFNDALQGGVCWCHGANIKLCCYDAKLFDESTKKWIVSCCTYYAQKGGECTMHGGIYKNKCAVIINGARNAPTELEMEGFVVIIIWKVSSNQKQAKENINKSPLTLTPCNCTEYGEALSLLQQLLPILHLYFARTQLSAVVHFFPTTDFEVQL